MYRKRNHRLVQVIRTGMALGLLPLLVTLCTAASILAWRYELLPPQRPLAAPPVWHGITVGQTQEQEAIRLIGTPGHTDTRAGYQIYTYAGRKDLGWTGVELWLQSRGDGPVVTGILGNEPYSSSKAISLADLGLPREHPERIYWSGCSRGYRYLLWPRQGIAARVKAERASAWGLPVREVMLFEPMSVWQAQGTLWPWPQDTSSPAFSCGWTSRGWLPPEDLPQDPFEW